MDPSEFINFAGRVVTMGQTGARSSVSRAYYGAFHLARNLIQELTGESAGSGKAHVLIPQFLRHSQHPAAVAAAGLLSDLHRDRIRADYNLSITSVEDVEFAKTRVEAALEMRRLLEQFQQECLGDPQLMQALRDGVARVKSIHQA